jgi:hypothetical protein
MADQPVMSQIDKQLQDSLAALAHKHVTMSYALIGMLAFILLLCGVGAYFGAKVYDRELARAEAAEKLMEQFKQTSDSDRAAAQAQIERDELQRQQDAQQIANLQSQILNRDNKATTDIANVLKPGKSAQDAFSDLAAHYKLQTPFTVSKNPNGPDQLLSFVTADVQTFTATKIHDDEMTGDNRDKDAQLAKKDDSIRSLNDDLAKGKTAYDALLKTDQQCQKTVDDYKKVAKKSKFRVMLDHAKEVLLFAGGVYLGHKL